VPKPIWHVSWWSAHGAHSNQNWRRNCAYYGRSTTNNVGDQDDTGPILANCGLLFKNCKNSNSSTKYEDSEYLEEYLDKKNAGCTAVCVFKKIIMSKLASLHWK
jgi:hypothetical protein